ncbi:E3 ubiquitin-protein ligase RNF43 isoform X1 [Tachysurus ichikawai]
MSCVLKKSHPLSLCNTSEDERQESFISIVKLESPESKVPQCLPLLEKKTARSSLIQRRCPPRNERSSKYLRKGAHRCSCNPNIPLGSIFRDMSLLTNT